MTTDPFNFTDGGSTVYASYVYLGLDRLIKTEHPSTAYDLTLAYSLGSAGQYSGLDRFGRVVQKLWKKGILDGGNFDGYVYTYDRNSNVLTRDYWASGNNNTFDEQFTYDGLDRLASFKRGTLSGSSIPDASVKFSQTWNTLDSLGNWQGSTQDADGYGGSAATTQSRTSNAARNSGGFFQGRQECRPHPHRNRHGPLVMFHVSCFRVDVSCFTSDVSCFRNLDIPRLPLTGRVSFPVPSFPVPSFRAA